MSHNKDENQQRKSGNQPENPDREAARRSAQQHGQDDRAKSAKNRSGSQNDPMNKR